MAKHVLPDGMKNQLARIATTFQENRLKVSSGLCIVADALMGMAGAAGLYRIGHNDGDFLLMLGGALGLFGHSVNVIWGKGGKKKKALNPPDSPTASVLPVFFRPFLMWRYPMDASFAIFSIGSVAFMAAGISSGVMLLTVFGSITLLASLLGWLWPLDKNIFGFRAVQICALLYMSSGIVCLASGLSA